MNHQRQGDHSLCDGQHRQCNVHNGLIQNELQRQSDFYGGMANMELWYWLISHNISSHEIDQKPTGFPFICISSKKLEQICSVTKLRM